MTDYPLYRLETGRKSVCFDERAPEDVIRFVIIHYTALDFIKSFDLLTEGSSKVSAHYLIPAPNDHSYPEQELKIFRLVDEDKRAWHAGKSCWMGEDDLNSSSIGIELVNQTHTLDNGKIEFLPFPQRQIHLLIELCKQLQHRYPSIKSGNFLGHCDIAPGRKLDPGPLFPWKQLHEHGISSWFNEELKNTYLRRYHEQGMPTRSHLEKNLSQIGYSVGKYNADFPVCIKSLQMHFRPCLCDGAVDVETAAILDALATPPSR